MSSQCCRSCVVRRRRDAQRRPKPAERSRAAAVSGAAGLLPVKASSPVPVDPLPELPEEEVVEAGTVAVGVGVGVAVGVGVGEVTAAAFTVTV
jgi:hypothetical protein